MEKHEFDDAIAYTTPFFLGVPYGCLLSKAVDNLPISGRFISTIPGQTTSGPTLGSYNNMKSISAVMTYGEAAGIGGAGQFDRKLLVSTLKKTRSGAFTRRKRRSEGKRAAA